jgi:hypothetical protein
MPMLKSIDKTDLITSAVISLQGDTLDIRQ